MIDDDTNDVAAQEASSLRHHGFFCAYVDTSTCIVYYLVLVLPVVLQAIKSSHDSAIITILYLFRMRSFMSIL